MLECPRGPPPLTLVRHLGRPSSGRVPPIFKGLTDGEWDLRLLRHFGPAVIIMKMRIAAVIATLTLLGATPVSASVKPAALVKAAKGPVQITLRLQKTKVKVKDSLWYKLELKNIGKKKLQVHDRIFKDPYAIHVNSRSRYGLYLEVVDSKGKPLRVKWGNYRLRYDWEGPEGSDYTFTPEEKKEINTLEDEWKRSGMTAQQQSIAWTGWVNELYHKKNLEELVDPAKKHWLESGASTATFAWADRGDIVDYPGRAEDDESLRQGYTELWIYWHLDPGRYRIRAVYDHAPSKRSKALQAPNPERIEFKTPFIDIEVLP